MDPNSPENNPHYNTVTGEFDPGPGVERRNNVQLSSAAISAMLKALRSLQDRFKALTAGLRASGTTDVPERLVLVLQGVRMSVREDYVLLFFSPDETLSLADMEEGANIPCYRGVIDEITTLLGRMNDDVLQNYYTQWSNRPPDVESDKLCMIVAGHRNHIRYVETWSNRQPDPHDQRPELDSDSLRDVLKGLGVDDASMPSADALKEMVDKMKASDGAPEDATRRVHGLSFEASAPIAQYLYPLIGVQGLEEAEIREMVGKIRELLAAGTSGLQEDQIPGVLKFLEIIERRGYKIPSLVGGTGGHGVRMSLEKLRKGGGRPSMDTEVRESVEFLLGIIPDALFEQELATLDAEIRAHTDAAGKVSDEDADTALAQLRELRDKSYAMITAEIHACHLMTGSPMPDREDVFGECTSWAEAIPAIVNSDWPNSLRMRLATALADVAAMLTVHGFQDFGKLVMDAGMKCEPEKRVQLRNPMDSLLGVSDEPTCGAEYCRVHTKRKDDGTEDEDGPQQPPES